MKSVAPDGSRVNRPQFSSRTFRFGWVAAMRSPFKRKVEKMIEEERKNRTAKGLKLAATSRHHRWGCR